MSKSFVLVSCVGKKLTHPAPAHTMYCSPWFKFASTYAEQSGAPWFILSAEYGLVEPNRVILPYELRLIDLPFAERLRWATRVHKALLRHLPETEVPITIRVFAGKHYRKHLLPLIAFSGYQTEVPLAGLKIGEQLSWFKRQNSHTS